MSKDQVIGALLVLVSIVVIVLYIWFVFFPGWLVPPWIDIVVLKLTGTVAIIVVFGILAWIGYTLATTPPPKPIEEIEKELEQELKELEKKEAEERKEEKPAEEAKPEEAKAEGQQ